MKTIIAYTSRYGCTEKAANLLKSSMGGDIDVVNLIHDKELSLTAYDTVILGGSIYYGKIQKEMTAFVNKIKPQLSDKHVGLFICAGMKGDQAAQELWTAFPEDLLLSASAIEVFGDEVYHDKLTLMDKFVLRMVGGKGKKSQGLSVEAIERFASAMKA